MRKRITFIIICLLTFWATETIASPQMPDYVIYDNDTIATYNLILEQYLQRLDSTETEQLFGLTFRDGASFNCWRGYQAIYKIENDSLFLADIINCGELRNGQIDKNQSVMKIKSIFGKKVKNSKVFINWFNGFINFPLTNKVLRWDGVFFTIFEKEKVITFSNGFVENVEDFDNYIDDPKRIDRRDKSEISNFLFKKLKRAKWKNPDEFDCSESYFVTINKKGIVSKVRMVLSDEEIDEYYEPDEYNFCIDKIMTALKDLKFDVIMNKGKPISEDIYIEIFIEDNGKIENWTD
ncbi:hypothetical protein [Flammeovirga kamogawensis]|uniref:Uncharacterized protein n=1 Tax=Flammeovirga kamogawensis TaxID=373891 RepID=A0ABX8H2U5_9BACT|nr:hypothetical protein [Flammeovirga kamogawensis]MBB6460130.1 hypothetical protein [Flammeovirga kamogawensis]QWG09944.1 hypothetical protein KM029_19885 [Flammeovirga kamogawensis]